MYQCAFLFPCDTDYGHISIDYTIIVYDKIVIIPFKFPYHFSFCLFHLFMTTEKVFKFCLFVCLFCSTGAFTHGLHVESLYQPIFMMAFFFPERSFKFRTKIVNL
jgi:hypothetical protein